MLYDPESSNTETLITYDESTGLATYTDEFTVNSTETGSTMEFNVVNTFPISESGKLGLALNTTESYSLVTEYVRANMIPAKVVSWDLVTDEGTTPDPAPDNLGDTDTNSYVNFGGGSPTGTPLIFNTMDPNYWSLNFTSVYYNELLGDAITSLTNPAWIDTSTNLFA
jgi:hypothetical protein